MSSEPRQSTDASQSTDARLSSDARQSTDASQSTDARQGAVTKENVVFEWQTMQRAVQQRVIGIVRTEDAASAIEATAALVGAGLLSVELTLTNPAALEAISQTVTAHPDAVIGAGSVLDGPSAVAAIRAGARYLVSPTLSTEMIVAARRYGVPTIVGTASPTEMLTAMEAGAAAVKLFPASSFSPRWISDVRAALPQLPIIPTGGVTPENAADWLAAGAVAVGIGSALTKGPADEAARRIRTLLAAIGSDADADADDHGSQPATPR